MMSKIFTKIVNSICIVLLLGSCADPMPIKPHPEHVGVDPKVQSIADEYFWLSKQNHFTFDHKVTIGFKNINHGDVIGLCTSTWFWREIDLDTAFWDRATKTSRMALLFHELTHCYCGRNHDFALGKDYPDTVEKRMKQAFEWINSKDGPIPGYLDDGCPASIMYPEILEDECTLKHYNDYIQEMFDRCQQ